MTPRVALLNMPFVGCERPSLGLSLLQAQLRRRAIPCDVHYLTFPLADRLGAETYDWVSNELPYTAFVGDWVFARSLYGSGFALDRKYVREVLVQEWRLSPSDVERIYRVRAACELYLASCLADPRWQSYEVVGFTSTFTQNLASLALAKLLKRSYPQLRIVFGGANWDGEMGEVLHSTFPFVDYACIGEAENSFPALVETIGRSMNADEADEDRRNRVLSEIPGLVYRLAGRTVSTGPSPPILDLDTLPHAVFDSYYRDLAASTLGVGLMPRPLLETSRGCWWGAKSHCTFCGLNSESLVFRSKSPERVLAEIRELDQRYRAPYIEVVDNILDMRYFRTVLPRLRDEGPAVRLFYEVKANLTFEQVRLLHESGVHTIQPGIESFSDHVLDLMGKGTTALQNVQLLKWCREFGLRPQWNLLYGFSGETATDYAEMIPLIDAIRFLDPPTGYGPVRLDRFSPYHARPSKYGLSNLRPLSPYQYLYPQLDQEELLRVAYYFDYDRADASDAAAYVGPVLERIRSWQAEEQRGDLWLLVLDNDDLLIWDERRNRPHRKLRLRDWRARVYLACDSVKTRLSLLRLVSGQAARKDLDTFLGLMVKLGLMVCTGERFLSLAVHRKRRDRSSEERLAGLHPPGHFETTVQGEARC